LKFQEFVDIAFTSDGDDLVSDDTNFEDDVFVYDRGSE